MDGLVGWVGGWAWVWLDEGGWGGEGGPEEHGGEGHARAGARLAAEALATSQEHVLKQRDR